MTPAANELTHITLRAPENWDNDMNGPCVGLPVHYSDGVFYSYWKTTWRERLAVLFGRPIRLSLMHVTHPPVMLDTAQR